MAEQSLVDDPKILLGVAQSDKPGDNLPPVSFCVKSINSSNDDFAISFLNLKIVQKLQNHHCYFLKTYIQ